MKRYFLLGAVVSSFAIAAACSSSSSTDDGGTSDASNDTTQNNDSSKPDGSGSDAANDGSTTDGGGDASNQLTLTIQNYLAWCAVTVNGGSANTSATQTYQFAPDASVALHGDTANSGAFYWGYWGNVNDAGVLADGGTDLSQDVNFTITSDVTLHACCPDNGQPLSQCTF
jgi:ABC-type oligopeptide transport system substrate-binding subunit